MLPQTDNMTIAEQVMVACDELIRRVSAAMRAEEIDPQHGNAMIDGFLDARANATEVLDPRDRKVSA